MLMNIHTLDLDHQQIPQSIAAFLVQAPDGPILIETGPGATLPVLTRQLAHHGYSPADIKHVLVTHIHFDHAGAAGWWAQQGAQVYVHHIGAPHLIDPSKLIYSATRIYGAMMDTLWGELLPAPAARVTALHDGDLIEAAGLTFRALDTPGHARHHMVYQLGDIAFTGDVAGIRLPNMKHVDVPAPPPEFDLETWETSIDRLVGEKLNTLYLTHFGRVDDVDEHFQQLRPLLTESVAFVEAAVAAGVEREALVRQYEAWNRERSRINQLSEDVITRYETANPLFMSVDGIMRYLRKRSQA